MACAGLNIIMVSILTIKFLADNVKAKAGRKIIEEDVRRSDFGFDQVLTSPARFLVHYLIDQTTVSSGTCANADTRQSITTRPHHIYPWKTDNLPVFSIFVVILMHKSSERVISMLI
jgi:hypothetical protein